MDNKDIESEDVGVTMHKPFNPNNIKVELKSISVFSMAERIAYKEVKLNTEFQRKEGLWADREQSRLIESILIRFPLPHFYFEGSDPSKWLVIDGLQRLTSLKRFMVTKELKLTGLEFLKDLEGKGWDELARPQQRQINETHLQCYVVEGDEDVKFNIFKRINTGGLTLSDQEIRHAMHQDVADFLKDLAESQEFLEATNHKISSERMLDRDFVNRFLAFYIFDLQTEYAEDLDAFMNNALTKLASMSPTQRNDVAHRFKAAMQLATGIFGDAAFSKNQDYRRINKALFEVTSVRFAHLSEQERIVLKETKDDFKLLFYQKIHTDFGSSLSNNTGGKSNVILRHKVFHNLIQEVLSK